MPQIFLTPVQTGLILLACLYIVWAGRVDWAAGIYLSLASWMTIVRFWRVNHIWVLLVTMVAAAAVYWSKAGRRPLVPQRDVWIVPWTGLWCGWMLLSLGVNDVSLSDRTTILISLLMYTVAPLPIFLVFARDVRRLRGFAIAYLFTTMVGGGVALSRLSDLGISYRVLLEDPVLRQYGGGIVHFFARIMNIVNYHWFSYAFGVSLIFIIALLQLNRRHYSHVMLAISAAYCTYFLLILESKQTMGATIIAALLFVLWVARSGNLRLALPLSLLIAVVAVVTVSVFLARPELVLHRAGSLIETFNIVEDRRSAWGDGWAAFIRSPLWGVGFAQGASLGHNFFVNTLANQGLVGMVFLIGFLVFVGKQFRGIWSGRGTEQAVWRMAFLCVGLSTLISGQASGSPDSAWPLFWSATILWRLTETGE